MSVPVQLYTIKEVAKLCNVKEATVREWIKAGKLKASKLNDKPQSPWRIRAEVFEEFINERFGDG